MLAAKIEEEKQMQEVSLVLFVFKMYSGHYFKLHFFNADVLFTTGC